jgi:hypothetical protein
MNTNLAPLSSTQDNRQLMEDLARRVTPTNGAVINAVYEFQFVGDPGRYFMAITADGAALKPTVDTEDVCRLGLYAEDLRALLDGAAHLRGLFVAGRLRVFSHMAAAMRLEGLFSLPL